METTPAGWTLIDRAQAVLTRSYLFAGEGEANTFVARMGDGKLAVISPSCRTPDAAFAELAEFGEVGAIVVNNGFHHLGQSEWKARFPDADCYAPAAAIDRVRRKNPKAPELRPLSELSPRLGDVLSITELASTKCGETWAHARTEGGHVWYVSDILANMPKLGGPLPIKLLMRFTGSGPGFSVFGLAMKFIVGDKKAALRQLAAEMQLHPPAVLVFGHGPLLQQPSLAADTQALIAGAL